MLDDLHWADEVVIDLLQHLIGSVQRLPFMLITSMRPGSDAMWPPVTDRATVVSLTVQPLARADSDELALELLGEMPGDSSADQRLLGALFDRSGGNPLLLRVLASDAAVRAGQGIRTTLLLFYVTFYLGRPEWGAGLFLFQYAFGMLAAPIWQRIGVALGKRRAAILAEVLQALINLALVLTTPDRFWLVLALAFAQGLTQGSGNIMLRSMVADVADKQRAETGEERAGLYYSVFALADKIGGALAAGIALPLIAWFGFDPKVATNTLQALNGLLLVFSIGPAFAHAVSAAVISGFALDAEQHNAIRHRLDTAADPALQPAE